MSAAIKVERVSKTFRVWQHPSDMLLETLTLRRRHTAFRALSDVSFEVPPGSVTGIMGRNGAGKSTLLRIVAGTLDATSGRVDVMGRIAAILELGTGFSPDYTGRENIFLGGLCLGLKQSEIEQRFDEIVAFSEVGEFIDRPFRTFSSGMQARLTFAVATCVDPDILIVDEALAVGDARFQVKSFDRVREFKRRGKSILLVSHDMNQISSICDRAILLERGRVIADGLPQKVCNIYHEMLFSPAELTVLLDNEVAGVAANKLATSALLDTTIETPAPAVCASGTDPTTSTVDDLTAGTADAAAGYEDAIAAASSAAAKPPVVVEATPEPAPTKPGEPRQAVMELAPERPEEHRYGDGAARIVGIRIITPDGRPVGRLKSLETYHLVCRIRAERAVGELVFGWLLRDLRGLDLFGWDLQTGNCQPLPPLPAGGEHEIAVRFRANLGGGTYFITPAIASVDKHKYDVRFEALEISVEGTDDIYTTSIVNLEPQVDVRK